MGCCGDGAHRRRAGAPGSAWPLDSEVDGQDAVIFLKALPQTFTHPEQLLRQSADYFLVRRREVVVHYHTHLPGSPYSVAFFERHLGVSGTLRNWRTVMRVSRQLSPSASGDSH